MCRSGGRRCPAYSDPVKIAERNARRRAAYALNKGKKAKSTKNTQSVSKNVDSKTNQGEAFGVKDNETETPKTWDTGNNFLDSLLNEPDENESPNFTKTNVIPNFTKTGSENESAVLDSDVLDSSEKIEPALPVKKVKKTVGEKATPKKATIKKTKKEVALDEALTKKNKEIKDIVNNTKDTNEKDALLNAKLGNQEGLYNNEAVELLNDGKFKDDTLGEYKYFADKELYSVSSEKSYHEELNLDVQENDGRLVELGYFTKKTYSGILDYTKLAETDDSEFGFGEIKKSSTTKGNDDLFLNKEKTLIASDNRTLGKKETQDMSSDDNKAMRYFTSNSYTWVNRALFDKKTMAASYTDGGKPLSSPDMSITEAINHSYDDMGKNVNTLRSITKHLDEALEKGPKKQRILYRGVKRYAAFLDNKPASQWVDENMEVGKEIVFDGYQSATPLATSVGGYSSTGGILYEIVTPEGVNVEDITEFQGENEVLLPRKARYAVVSINKNVDVHLDKYSSVSDNVVIRLVAINSKGEVLDGTNSDPIEPLTEDYFESISESKSKLK